MSATGVFEGISNPTLLVEAARAMAEQLDKGPGGAMLTVLMKEKGFLFKMEDSGNGGDGRITIGG